MKNIGLILGCALLTGQALAHENGTIKIYDGKFTGQLWTMAFWSLPRPLLIKDGKAKKREVSESAYALYNNLEKTRDFYAEKLGRRSWDNKGATIKGYINTGKYAILDILGSKENAYWNPGSKCFHFGIGNAAGLDGFEEALDVIGHEYTHAVVQTTSNLKYEGQSGALNEHLADVFGAIINKHENWSKNPYLIGATVLKGNYKLYAEALRDMEHPEEGLSVQPGHMNDLSKARFSRFVDNCTPSRENDNCGVHILSGIPNKMAAKVIKELPLEDAAKLFYNVMTERLKEKSQFADYSVALQQECQNINAETCRVVDEALASVGL